MVDIFHPAELLPGFRDYGDLTSDGLLQKVSGSSTDMTTRFTSSILFVVFFIPAYAYRLSIKSTFWLYLPIVYMASTREIEPRSAEFLNLLERSRKEWGRRGLALVTLAGFAYTTFGSDLTAKLPEHLGIKFVSPLEYLFLIEFDRLKLWQVFNLLSALITVGLFFASDVRVGYEYAHDIQSQRLVERNVERIKMLMRIRNISSAFLILILGVHALLVFSPIVGWLLNYILGGLSIVYGAYMPPLS